MIVQIKTQLLKGHQQKFWSLSYWLDIRQIITCSPQKITYFKEIFNQAKQQDHSKNKIIYNGSYTVIIGSNFSNQRSRWAYYQKQNYQENYSLQIILFYICPNTFRNQSQSIEEEKITKKLLKNQFYSFLTNQKDAFQSKRLTLLYQLLIKFLLQKFPYLLLCFLILLHDYFMNSS
ncbi:hypothetical protein pb186bvf_006302 [Paramecium bursaria]